MSGITYDYIEQYIKNLIPENEGLIKELERYAIQNSIPIIQKEVANFLDIMINIKRPENILELGTAIGYSSILMSKYSGGRALIKTIERDKKMVDIARNNIASFGLEDKITVVEGDCLEVLENMEDQYDMIFIDAGKGHYNHFLPHCIRLLKRDGIIIADNVLFRGMVASDELVTRRKVTIVKRMRIYLDEISKNEDLVTSVIPMGDGIAVTTRRNK